jgi:hypothetical protein
MRRLIASESVTLDGVMEAPGHGPGTGRTPDPFPISQSPHAVRGSLATFPA